jgi:uncharacterized protein (DUF1800 family)
MTAENRLKHLLNRAAFGVPMGENLEIATFDNLLKDHTQNKPIQVVEPEASDMGLQSSTGINEKRKQTRNQFVDLNTSWFNQLTESEVMMREKMTLFWHDHFACQVRRPFLAQQQINTIRKHALGRFGDLLMAVSKDPAMLLFLNNQQNRKNSPNENFAREVMELFTLGRGNYSEEDIKNAARAFTGWGFNPVTSSFAFNARQHDDGEKIFRGKGGPFQGEDIIQLILEDRQTARYITGKISSFFVGNVPDEVIQEWSELFFRLEYDISGLLKTIYSSPEFNDPSNVGNRIKSPLELLAGIQTHTNGVFQNPLNIVFLQRALGQTLLQPPNVSGWPSGKEWIDSSSLAFRMSLPNILFKNSLVTFEAKDDGDINNDSNLANRPANILFSVDFNAIANRFSKKSTSETLEAIGDYLMACPVISSNKKIITAAVAKSTNDPDFMKRAYTALMALPEYQLN